MSSAVRTIVVSVVLAVATFTIAWVVVHAVRDDGADAASPEGEELSVAEAAHVGIDQRVAVRGFVFVDELAGTLLCSQTSGGERPACQGDVLRLVGLDVSRLALASAAEAEGGYDAWSDGEVVLLGTTVGGAGLRVEDVLPT